MLGIMARRTIREFGSLIDDSGSGMCKVGLSGVAPRAAYCRQARVAGLLARLCNDRFPGTDSAEGGAVLGQISLARRCASTGAGVGPDMVQLLDKIVGMPVVGLMVIQCSGPWSLHRCSSWTGYCRYDRCGGPDSENCLEVLQLLFEGRRHPCLYAVADPMVLVVRKP